MGKCTGVKLTELWFKIIMLWGYSTITIEDLANLAEGKFEARHFGFLDSDTMRTWRFGIIAGRPARQITRRPT